MHNHPVFLPEARKLDDWGPVVGEASELKHPGTQLDSRQHLALS